jgi:MscS family membrane protein
MPDGGTETVKIVVFNAGDPSHSEWLPLALAHREGPLGLHYWQWALVPGVVFGAWLVGKALAHLSQRLLRRLAASTRANWDDQVVSRVRGPLTLLWAVLLLRVASGLFGLSPGVTSALQNGFRAGFLAALFWGLARSIDVLSTMVVESSWAVERPTYRALLPLGSRVAKVLVIALALVALLSELGYPVASLIAGLGLGGLAFALAAQKTVENLFGAFTLGADQPFREGDFVRLEDVVGTVEAIGLRSTRIRTLDRTLVTVPNGKLAEMRLESFAARDRIRLVCTVGLVYDTTAEQMRLVLSGIEQLLRRHAKIWSDNVVVRFSALGPSSLDIEVMAWFTTTDWGEFQGIRQDMLLGIMEVVESAGTAFAYPTSTVHVVGN